MTGHEDILPRNELESLAAKRSWILDVDDCLYPISCGLHDYIKGNIVNVFNKVAAHDPDNKAIVQRLETILDTQSIKLENPARIKPEELGLAFPPIVRALRDVAPDSLLPRLNAFYGQEYRRIKPCPDLVKAFTTARDKGIEIFIYTNGPSSPQAGEMAHLQKVMERLGFEQDTIDAMRTRTYDLLMSVEAGRGKPSADSMQDFLKFSGIDPQTAFMADDSIKNLATAQSFGIKPLWTWTTTQPAAEKDIGLAQAIGAPSVILTGAALLQIALRAQ